MKQCCHFTHPAQNTTNSPPHFKKEKEQKKRDPHREQEKVKKEKKAGGKLIESKLVKLKEITLNFKLNISNNN